MLLTGILSIINAFILLSTGKKPMATGEKWTVYGTMNCGWTRKQLEYMKNKGKNVKFIDCSSQKCAGINGYPTIIHPDGRQTAGYVEV